MGKPDFSAFLYQSPPEKPFPERNPSRFNTNSPLELNLIIALTSLYFFHFITDLVRNSMMFPFSCKYLNTCTISLLLSSISLSFFTSPCTRYMPQRDHNRTRVNDSLLKEEREIFLWLLLCLSDHGYKSRLPWLLMTNFTMSCKALGWHCWPNFGQCCAAEAPSLFQSLWAGLNVGQPKWEFCQQTEHCTGHWMGWKWSIIKYAGAIFKPIEMKTIE